MTYKPSNLISVCLISQIFLKEKNNEAHLPYVKNKIVTPVPI